MKFLKNVFQFIIEFLNTPTVNYHDNEKSWSHDIYQYNGFCAKMDKDIYG